MVNGLNVEIDDQVTGRCPACQRPEIEFICTQISGNASYKVYMYALRCSHQDVCALRREFMGEDE